MENRSDNDYYADDECSETECYNCDDDNRFKLINVIDSDENENEFEQFEQFELIDVVYSDEDENVSFELVDVVDSDERAASENEHFEMLDVIDSNNELENVERLEQYELIDVDYSVEDENVNFEMVAVDDTDERGESENDVVDTNVNSEFEHDDHCYSLMNKPNEYQYLSFLMNDMNTGDPFFGEIVYDLDIVNMTGKVSLCLRNNFICYTKIFFFFGF